MRKYITITITSIFFIASIFAGNKYITNKRK